MNKNYIKFTKPSFIQNLFKIMKIGGKPKCM